METTKHPKFESAGSPSFDEAWENYIIPNLKNLINKPLPESEDNTIIAVESDSITRRTPEGNTDKISIDTFRLAYEALTKRGYVTRKYIKAEDPNQYSSSVVIVLLENALPFVKKLSTPLIRLNLK